MHKSIELAGPLDYRPGLARSNLHFAELLQRKGDLDQARKHLYQATSLFRAMEMTWWLEQAEELGKTLNVG